MKPTKMLLLVGVNLMLAGFAARAQEGPSDDPSQGPPGGGRRLGPPPIAMLLTSLLEKYDVNKDGQLDPTELATLKQDIAAGKLPSPEASPGTRPTTGISSRCGPTEPGCAG